MAEVTHERNGTLVRGVFKILHDEPEGLPSRKVLALLATEVPPTSFEKRDFPNRPGTRRYEVVVRFATISYTKAGWLIKERGQWSLTDAGKEAYKCTPDPEQFHKKSIEGFKQWKKDQPPKGNNADGDPEQDGTETSSATLEESEENAWAEVENYLAEMKPLDFQEVVAGLLEGMGHHVQWVAPPGPDGGIDIHATTDSLGVSGKRIKVQVKRRQDALSVDAIRSFRDTLKDRETGLYVSIGGFTREADKEARRGQRYLVLIDAKRFFDLWVAHYEKIPEKRRRLLPIKLVAFLDTMPKGD